jgi:hypothetical protein
MIELNVKNSILVENNYFIKHKYCNSFKINKNMKVIEIIVDSIN